MMHPSITLYMSLLQIVNIWQWRVMQKVEEVTQDWQFLEFLSLLRFVTVVLAQVSTHSSRLCHFESFELAFPFVCHHSQRFTTPL
jgi:hypothetical protein